MDESPKRIRILELIKASIGKQFVIPVYQRNYTWTVNKELKQYLDDLDSVINKEKEYENHFLGIIIYTIVSSNGWNEELSVIDGQQRLVTTFLMLYAIRDILLETKSEQNTEKAKTIENLYLINSGTTDSFKLRLKPLINDDSVFKKIIHHQFDEISEKESNVYKNYLAIKRWIYDRLDKNINIDQIMVALNKFYIVEIPLSKEDNPQKIFESINSTGIKLTASDLIRNYILMNIPSDEQDAYYNKYWISIERAVDSDSKKLEMFFRIYLSVKEYAFYNLNAIYKMFKIFFVKQISNGLQKEDILLDIENYANVYHQVCFSELDEFDPRVATQLFYYRQLGFNLALPLITEFFMFYKENKIDANTLSELLKIVISYAMRRALCSKDTSDITRLFPSILNYIVKKIDETNDYTNIKTLLIKSLINANKLKASFMPTDKDLINYLKNENIYVLASSLKIAFLEIIHADINNDYADMEVKQLIPPNDQKWQTILKLSKEDYDKKVNTIGNLIFLPKKVNPEFSGNYLQNKNQIADNAVNLNLKNWDSITVKELDDRASYLVEKIQNLFPYYYIKDNDENNLLQIHITVNNLNVYGIFNLETGSVEILKDSTMVNYSNENSLNVKYHDQYYELLDEGVIKEINNQTIFLQNYVFDSKRANETALSKTALFVLMKPRNGRDTWLDENNNPLSQNEVFSNSKFSTSN